MKRNRVSRHALLTRPFPFRLRQGYGGQVGGQVGETGTLILPPKERRGDAALVRRSRPVVAASANGETMLYLAGTEFSG